MKLRPNKDSIFGNTCLYEIFGFQLHQSNKKHSLNPNVKEFVCKSSSKCNQNEEKVTSILDSSQTEVEHENAETKVHQKLDSKGKKIIL